MKLIIEPRVTSDWKTFTRDCPQNSVALDWRVSGPPKVKLDTLHANFNHHEGVVRLATASTSEQVLIALKTGFSDTFRLDDLNMYINDPDQDTALALWILINHDRLEWTKSEPLITRLISVGNMLDITSGMYPFGVKSKVMRQLAWIFSPYVNSRVTGELFKANAATMRNIIESIHARIDKYALWTGNEEDLDTRCEIVGWGMGWSLVKEIWFYSRGSYLEKWIKSFISINQIRPDGKYIYSIWKASNFINFPILEIYRILNTAEGIPESSTDKWWWSDTIGWSPRNTWSSLTPEKLTEVINTFLSQRKY